MSSPAPGTLQNSTPPALGGLTKSHTFPMVPASFRISPSASSHFVSNDGALTVDVPAGAINDADLAADGGKTSLLVRQVNPASGSSAGGSGHVSFGTFLVQVVDATGHLSKHGLRKDLNFTLKYGKGAAVDLAHAYSIVNGPIPSWVNLDPSSVFSNAGPSSLPTTSPAGRGAGISNTAALQESFGPLASAAVSVDAARGSFITQFSLSGSSGAYSWGTFSSVSTFGKPDPVEVQLSAGALTTGYPIDVPKGPGGFTPPLTLAYNSAGVSDQHNTQGAAPWVGEGWNMSLGAISWAEHNATSGGSSATWEDSWQLSDAFGTGAEIIPPNINVATYYDDTPNSITASPIPWHTAPETHARVYSIKAPFNLPSMPDTPPCFRVFLPNGVMEEFGCTPDSLQYWPNACAGYPNNTCDYLANWNLDMITDRQGNQIHVTYQTDSESTRGFNYPRDAVMATVEYDSPGCLNAQTGCTGSSWTPLMRVNFQATHSVAHTVGSSCAGTGNLRCDDPVDLSGSSGDPAPTVQSTFVLNDVQVQVRTSGTSAWNTLRDYQLGYDQSSQTSSPLPNYLDPISGKPESVAGRLDLTQLKVIGDDSSTTSPLINFGYTSQTEYYVDSLQKPTPTTNCGPTWNKPCNLWSQSFDGNSYYLTSVSNGLGLAQAFTYQLAHENKHGVNGGGSNTSSPFYCNNSTYQNSYPCYDADDEAWSRAVLTQQQNSLVRLTQQGQGGTQTSTPVNGTTSYNYTLAYYLKNMECSDCVAGATWGNQNDNDVLDFYNAKFFGFAIATVTNPDGSVETHKYYTTEGWGLYDPSQVTCLESYPCHPDAYWDLANAAHGHEFEVDRTATDGVTVLQQVKTQYQAICPPSGVSGSPPAGYGTWGGNLVSSLDRGNPVGVCDIHATTVDSFSNDGASGTVPDLTKTYAFDTYGRVTSETDTTNNGSANGSPTTIVNKTSYIWNDALTATPTSATGAYLIDFPSFTDTEDTSGNRYQCTYTGYDGQANTTGQTSGLTLGEVTRTDKYTSCATPTGQISATTGYDSYGNVVTGNDPDANAGNPAHVGCTVGSSTYSTCSTYDGIFDALATSSANALNQAVHNYYQLPSSATAAGGFGLWPTSTSDVNSQSTAYTYDGLGRQTSVTLPAESSGLTTQTIAYTVWCSGTAAQSPCAEVDQTQRLNNTTTVTDRAFFDGMGHLVETRSPGGSGDIVQYSYYDYSQRLVFKSVPYFVTAYNGAPGAAAYSIPDSTQAGTNYTYDGLGRTITTKDALSEQTNTTYSVVCNAAGTSDSACYEQTTTNDPLGHKSAQLVDAFARTQYVQRFTGNAPANYVVYATTKYTYDYTGDLTQILHPDGATKTTYQYDMTGRKTGMTDPDRGSEIYAYDQNSNPTQSIDARGSAGTVYVGYDGLNRPTWRNTTNSPTGAYDTYSYDSVANGNVGVGRLTGEAFSGAPNNTLSGSDSYVYDVRGQQTSETLVVGGTNYPLSATYDDAGDMLTQTYSDGETVTNSFSGQGLLTGVSTSQGSTTLLSGASYTGIGGAFGLMTAGNLMGSVYQYGATADLLGRATDINVKRSSNQATVFDQARTFDAAGNVSTADTTIPAGTDNQAFCYDEQNRLIAAASSGTVSCQTFTPGSLSAANYNQTFAYDTMGRLTSGPLGTYTYGDNAHVHAATAIGTAYTATYDAAGNMSCRAPSSASTCSGTQTGAQLTYNNEGQLSNWQNQPSSPTSTNAFLYDGQGNRVAQQSTSSGTTTTTVYVGNVEEDSTTGSTTTKTSYYYANGARIAMATGGSAYAVITDGLGSTNALLDTSGNTAAAALFAPYGKTRYASGNTSLTDYGFTGQHTDSTSLEYFGARYYDRVAGQFTSADTVVPGSGYDVWGLSRYAYVEGNPVIRIDPSGHRVACVDDPTCGNFYGSGGPTGHANGKPAPQTHPSPSHNSNPVPVIATASLLGRSSGPRSVEDNDPFFGWPQNMYTDYTALEGNITSFWEKAGELITDDGQLFTDNPASYVQHIEAIRSIQAKMLTRFLEMLKGDPDVANAMKADVESAQNFDPVAVRGLPEGYTETSVGGIVKTSGLGTDSPVDPFDPGALPEPVDPLIDI